MNGHWNDEAVSRFIDGEDSDDQHLRECVRCSNAVVAALQLKRAVRDAVPRLDVPESLRRSVLPRQKPTRSPWWIAAAAVLLLMILGSAAMIASRQAAARQLVDLHTTIIGSASPIDVVSTDRHTVKPWFEGKVPFAVDMPDLAGTPFHLEGGRVVFWRGKPAAYLLITKGAHRVSLFEFAGGGVSQLGADSMTVLSWRANGLAHVAVSDLPREELEGLRR